MDNSALSVQLRELIKTECVDFDLLFPQPILADLFRELRTDKIAIQDFEIFLLSLTASYFDLVNINKNRLAAISTAKKFANIAKAIATVKNEINALSDSERNVFLDRLNQINLPEYRRTEIRNILANDQKVAETDTRIEFVNPQRFLSALDWLEHSTNNSSNGDGLEIAHRGSDEHIQMLVRQIRHLWVDQLKKKFTRDFLQNKSEKEITPISDAALFCCRIAYRLDPGIKDTQIATAMKYAITTGNKTNEFVK